MENMNREILFGEVDFPLNLVLEMGVELAQPLQFDAVVPNVDRNIIPRNQNYYEETIIHYMGDLFVEHFRMTREVFENLTHVIANAKPIHPRTVIMFEKKILFTVWVLAKPETFLAAGDRFGFARSTAHEVFSLIEFGKSEYDHFCLKLVIESIYEVSRIPQRPPGITWPQHHEEAINVFHERSHGIPGVVGAIDGCHIAINQPVGNAVDYYNRKQFHSIILQGTCDHRLLFMDIFVGIPGRAHDASVFRESPLYRAIINEDNPLLTEEKHIIGDSAYPLLTNLLTPFRDNGHLYERETHFNMRLSTIRSVIERAFARLKGKFRRLKYLDIGTPDFGVKIITASCVLHNFIILNGNDQEDVEIEEIDEEIIPLDNHQYPRELRGQQKRIQIAKILIVGSFTFSIYFSKLLAWVRI